MNSSDRIAKLFKEPLLHFLLIGAALFLLNGWRGNSVSLPGGQPGTPTAQVVVTLDDINQMNGQFAKTWQRLPNEVEQKGLIEDFIRNEIFYREALAIGLERDDEVLRRRLRQKMEFIFENISSMAEPTEADLQAFLLKQSEKYLTDPKTAFRQVFISKYKRGERAESDARQILAQLTAGADPDTVGDSTLLEPEVPLSPLWDIRKQFGDEFARSLLDIKLGRWAGPVRSGFGLHLVFVKDRMGGRMPDLNEVREAVKRDWMIEKQKDMKDAAYAKIRNRYAVTIEKPKMTTASLVPSTKKKVIAR
jgi:hypothetical protein